MDEMREKPIIFNGQMVRAILEGRKTQTRRIMKPYPVLHAGGFWHFRDCQWKDGGLGFPQSGIEDHAPYQLGDRLWVRETFRTVQDEETGAEKFIYRADPDKEKNPYARWRPSIHMPRTASRIMLEVTDVRAERLQDIGEDEAIAEGIEKSVYLYTSKEDRYRESYRSGFARQWDAVYMNWGSNPWVWVICFRVL